MPIVTRAPVLLALVVLLVAAPAGVTAPPAAAGAAVPVGGWPLRPPPEVVRGFDPPDARWGAGHRGVDLLGSPGVAVRAALPGLVSFAGRIAGRSVVVVDHGETRTTYEPVLAAVRRGHTVAAGAVLGHLASAGSHCPPRACLHWGWLRGETYLDPLLLVGAGPVRLLPLDAPAPPAVRVPEVGGSLTPVDEFTAAHVRTLPTASPCLRSAADSGLDEVSSGPSSLAPTPTWSLSARSRC